jgi:hypothetical protein
MTRGAAFKKQPMPGNLQFIRDDWTLFRTVEGLSRRVFVPKGKLRRLVLKEIAENAGRKPERARRQIGLKSFWPYAMRSIPSEDVRRIISAA